MTSSIESTAIGPRRRRRWLRRAALAVAAVVVLGGVAVGALLLASPDYWQTTVVDGSDPAVARRAEAFEREVSSETTAVRQAYERWEIELSQDEVNEWLAARLPQWMRNRGVDETAVRHAKRAVVAIKSDRVELATVVRLGKFEPVVRLVYEPEVNDAGRVQLSLDRMFAGLMPVPGDSLVDEVLEQYGPLDEDRQRRVDHARKVLHELDLVLHLGDGRVVSVVGMELEDGRVSLVCITAPTAVRRDGTVDPDYNSG